MHDAGHSISPMQDIHDQLAQRGNREARYARGKLRSVLTAFVDERQALEHRYEDHTLGEEKVIEVCFLIQGKRLHPPKGERQKAHDARVHHVRPDGFLVPDVGQEIFPAHELELSSGVTNGMVEAAAGRENRIESKEHGPRDERVQNANTRGIYIEKPHLAASKRAHVARSASRTPGKRVCPGFTPNLSTTQMLPLPPAAAVNLQG